MTHSNGLDRFAFPTTGQQIRVVHRGDELWFVALDVCAILGYAHAGSALRMLRPQEKGVHPTHTLGGLQDLAVINEPGLYRLIMRSNRAEAEAFQDWVTTEVLPQIRRTGVYGIPQQIPSHAESLRGWAAEIERREAAEQRVAELEPAAARAAQTIDAEGLALVGTVAKRFGVKETFLREFLRRGSAVQLRRQAQRTPCPLRRLRAPRGQGTRGRRAACPARHHLRHRQR